MSNQISLNNETLPYIPKHVSSILNIVVQTCSSFNLMKSRKLMFQIGFVIRYFDRSYILYEFLKGSVDSTKKEILLAVSGILRSSLAAEYCRYCNKNQVFSITSSMIYAFILSIEHIIILLLSIKNIYEDFYQKNRCVKSFIKSFINVIRSSAFSSFITKTMLAFAYFYCVFVANIKQNIWWAFFAFIIEIIINSKKTLNFIFSLDFFDIGKQSGINQEFGYEMVQHYKMNGGELISGRLDEINHICQILSRRQKSNLILIGKPGVGKTAILEGLAQAIAKGDVPDNLKDKKIFSLNVASLIADTKFRGQFEKRITLLVKYLLQDGKTILFIDEIHNIIGAGRIKGNALDFSNILKQSLGRGGIQCIGATTSEEYDLYIKKEPAIVRRFEPILIYPPSIPDTLKMLNGLRESYEKHRRCVYNEDAILACVELSEKYIKDRCLPDKAIEVMDESAILALSCFGMRKDENEICRVSKNDVEKVISRKTNVQIGKEKEDGLEDLYDIEENEGILEKISNIKKDLTIVGQNEAINTVYEYFIRKNANIKYKNKADVFLILGQPGTGKSLVAKSFEKYLFGKNKSVIFLRMSDYSSSYSVENLTASSKDANSSPNLVDRLRMFPNSIIIMDCIEKAHMSVVSAILSIIEEGSCLDSSGRLVDFSKSVLVMTSSLFSEELNGSANFESEAFDKAKEKLLNRLKDFNKELVHRVDNHIILRPLRREDFEIIVENELNKFFRSLEGMFTHVDVSSSVKSFIVKKCYKLDTDARVVTRYIEKVLQFKIAKIIVGRNFSKVKVRLNESKDDIIVEGEDI